MSTASINYTEDTTHTDSVTLNNASDYRTNGLLSDYIGWTNGITDYRTRVRVRVR